MVTGGRRGVAFQFPSEVLSCDRGDRQHRCSPFLFQVCVVYLVFIFSSVSLVFLFFFILGSGTGALGRSFSRQGPSVSREDSAGAAHRAHHMRRDRPDSVGAEVM